MSLVLGVYQVSALFPWLNKYRILEKEEPDNADDLELEAEGSPSDDAFEAMLPFERRLSVKEAEKNEPPTPRSNLMSKFQSLRSSFKDLEGVPPTSLKKLPTSRRRASRTSMRSSLLVQELDGAQQGELQRTNVELEMKIINLESENSELQVEIEQLRQDLGRRNTSANTTDNLHEMQARSVSLGLQNSIQTQQQRK